MFRVPGVFRYLMTTVGLLLVLSMSTRAQEATASIVGTITDPQGGVVPGAKITAVNTLSHVSREVTTNREGYYELLALPIGTYEVTAEHQGFSQAISAPQTLHINEVLRVDMRLTLGSSTEVVKVTAQVSGVETVNATLGESVTSRPVVNMPLNGRNVLNLALLQPGVTETNPGSPGLFSVAGGRADSVTFLLDGGANNNLLNNLVVLNPNPDAIAEFRILTSNYSAEYGRNAGGIVSVVTKSGTNKFHGSAFEFVRNDAFNANKFFRNEQGLPREVLKRHQFGGTVGGPITIPHVVDGTDRLFFFFAYQGQRLNQLQTQAAVTVFTPAELRGDFSLSNTTRTGPDSNVVNFLKKFPFFQPNSSLASQGIIDPTRINSVSQKYIAAGLIPTASAGILFPTGTAQDNSDELLGKFDFVVTPNDRLAVTLGSRRNPLLNPFSAEANVPGFPTSTLNHRYYANISYTKLFSNNFLNDFRFNTQRNNNFQAVPARTLPVPSALGIGITPDNPTGPSQLVFQSGMTLGFNRNGPTDLVDNTFSFTDTASWILGRHTWKFGGGFTPYQDNTIFDFFINGRFDFNGTGGGIGSGNAFADFLFGLPDQFLQFPAAPSDIRTKNTYGFVQDEWRVRPNFTLSLGVRYEYSQPKFDTQGRSFSLAFGKQSTVFPNAPVGVLFPGDVGAPRGSNNSDFNDWAPRLGLAWDPFANGKTSIRAGVGVFYDILKAEDNLQFNGQAPFFSTAFLNFNPLSSNPSSEVNYLTQPFVAAGQPNPFPSKPPSRNINFASAGFLPFGGGGVFFVNPNLRTPYIYQYNLSIQHEIANNTIVEANYVGSSSHKLTDLVDASPFVLGTLHRLFNTQPGNTDGSFSFLDEFRNVSNASYNSLELSLQGRPTSESTYIGNVYYTLAYTYGHSIDNASGFRERGSRVPFYNPQQFVASSDYDIRHRITFSGGWDLPFGRMWSSGPSRLTKGWSLYPIVTWHTGFPLDVLAGFARSRARPGPSGAGDGNLVRANLVGSSVPTFDPKTSQTFNGRTGNFFFSPGNFTTAGLGGATCTPCATNPALRTYGSFPRNALRGPGLTNFDFAVAKATPLYRERLNLEFRAEFFNLFNHAEFANPSTNINSKLFGQITDTGDPRIIQFAARFTF